MVYREGLRVGYRHFAGRPVTFPFGHGLSYSAFEYRDLRLSASAIGTADPLQLTLTLTNTGAVESAEVVQLYVHPLTRAVPNAQPRPDIELRAFAKVVVVSSSTHSSSSSSSSGSSSSSSSSSVVELRAFTKVRLLTTYHVSRITYCPPLTTHYLLTTYHYCLQLTAHYSLLNTHCSLKVRLLPGTSTSVTLALRPRDFAFYDVAAEDDAKGDAKGAWCVAPGAYELRVGSSSADVRLTAMVQVGEAAAAAGGAAGGGAAGGGAAGGDLPQIEIEGEVEMDDEAMARVGCRVPAAERARPYSSNTTMEELGEAGPCG